MNRIAISALLACASAFSLYADYAKGQDLFKAKCSSCHGGFIAPEKIQENFFKRDNKLLKLKAPTVNMLAYALMRGPKKVGDPQDSELRQEEIAAFLQEYLEHPDRSNSICDPQVMRFYETKKPIRGLGEEDYMNLADYFMHYTPEKK